MSKPENRLWDYLDTCGIDFRSPRYQLVDLFGFRDCGWSDGVYYCEPKARADFIPNLVHSPVFQFMATTDMGVHPNAFFAYIRETNDARKNYKFAVNSLSKLFGEGRDASSSNTVSRCWDMGFARIEATIFPPKMNKGFPPNGRHKLVPGSETECAITIRLAWRDPMNERELAWAKNYDQLYIDPAPYSAHPIDLVGALTRDWPKELDLPTPGFAISTDKQALLHIKHPDLVDVIPTSWITAVARESLLAARGPAEANIVVYYLLAGQADLAPKPLWIAKSIGDPYCFDTLASNLAQTLDVPIYKSEQPNA